MQEESTKQQIDPIFAQQIVSFCLHITLSFKINSIRLERHEFIFLAKPLRKELFLRLPSVSRFIYKIFLPMNLFSLQGCCLDLEYFILLFFCNFTLIAHLHQSAKSATFDYKSASHFISTIFLPRNLSILLRRGESGR